MRWALLVVLAGCGRVGFDSVGAASDTLPPNLGQLDPSFGNGGISLPSTGVDGAAWDIGLRGSGYLINGVTRPTTSEVRMDVLALTETGGLDPAWPGGGEQLVGPNVSSFGYGVTMTPDGGAYITGDAGFDGQADNFVIGRLTAAGRLDPTFGGDGFVDHNIAPTNGGDTAWAATLVGDTLYACGIADYNGDPRMTLVALRPDGALDPGFATTGISTTNFTAQVDQCLDLAYDGTVLVAAGTVGNRIAIVDYDLAGASGAVIMTLKGIGNALAIAPDGARIVVAAEMAGGYVMRFAGGALDPGFATDGVVTTPRDSFEDVALDAEGRIVAAGTRDNEHPVVRRFLPDGSPDPTFADDGVFEMTVPGQLFGVAIDAAGRIVAVGYDGSGPTDQPLVLRLQ